jgi:hypothetical protein
MLSCTVGVARLVHAEPLYLMAATKKGHVDVISRMIGAVLHKL